MYKELNDNEIIYTLNESDDYYELMLEKYKPIINRMCNKYHSIANKCGYELNDLIQIASIALLNAMKYYKEEKNVLFYTFVIKCIDNALKSEIKNQTSNRKKILNNYISYDQIIEEYNLPLKEIIKNKNVLDPIDYLIIQEQEKQYNDFISQLPLEVAISFEMKNYGFKTSEIAKYLMTDEKTILKNIKYAKNRLCLN